MQKRQSGSIWFSQNVYVWYVEWCGTISIFVVISCATEHSFIQSKRHSMHTVQLMKNTRTLIYTHTLAQSYIGISIPHTYTHVVDFYVFPYFYVCIVPLTSFGLCKSAHTFSLERGCSAVCCVYVAEVHMRLS